MKVEPSTLLIQQVLCMLIAKLEKEQSINIQPILNLEMEGIVHIKTGAKDHYVTLSRNREGITAIRIAPTPQERRRSWEMAEGLPHDADLLR